MQKKKTVNSRAAITWAYAQAWVGKGASALVYMALGYLLDPHEFGSYAVASTFVVLAEMFVEQTVAQAVIQLPDDKPEQMGSLKCIALALGMFCMVGTLLLGLFLRATVQPSDLSMAWYAFELAPCPLLIAINAVPMGLYRKSMDYKALARRTALATLGGGTVGIIVAALHGGGHALVALTLTYQLLSYFILRGQHTHIALNLSWAQMRGLRGLMIVNGQPKVADFLESKGLELVVAQLMGLSVAGSLSYANKIAQTLFTFLASPGLDAAWGLFSHDRDDKAALFGVYQRHLAILSMTTTTLFFGLGMSSYQMIPLVLGSKWATLHQLLSWLCLALIVRTSLYLATILIQVFEPSLFVSSLAIGRAVLCLILTAALSPITALGDTKAVLGYALAGLIVVAPTARHMSKRLAPSMAQELAFRTLVPIGIFGLGWLAYLQARALVHGDIKPWLDGTLIASLSAMALTASMGANRWRTRRTVVAS
ncbi:hypothetical protein JY96_15635 [Aquabacterium sp. NJ1]|uniref:oligosaccharide flippase family protein n=1 Tax=Aquabacterium sp. NJ1 TaxID=1538295 RepID=UPI00052CAA23|nr:oligosaccharide flippase family protein [Aquabacterium sp. NJ1]KGM40997.1 hypothetical protein JY96_15635 [Aquabacterium sp. NJ1]